MLEEVGMELFDEEGDHHQCHTGNEREPSRANIAEHGSQHRNQALTSMEINSTSNG